MHIMQDMLKMKIKLKIVWYKEMFELSCSS